MENTFFGFDTSLAGDELEDGIDGPLEEDDIPGEEDEYDALNDETFGADAGDGDWEQDHEKLAKITESCRQPVPNLPLDKNGIDVDIEDSLSHLVLDEKDGTTPRPGVWDSPTNLPIPQNHRQGPISSNLKNVRTVEELERGLISSRPAPGISQTIQPQHQHQQLPGGGPFMFDSLSLNDMQMKGLQLPYLPPNSGLPAPMRLQWRQLAVRPPPPQAMQHHRLLPNQQGNMLRYPMPPHLMMPPGVQRQPPPPSFRNNFPHPPYPGLPPPPLLRPEHNMMPPFPNNPMNHQQQYSPHAGNQRPLQNNRPFHVNDQPSNHQPFFKNNQYPHHNHNRNNQRYQHPHHYQGMNGYSGSSGDYDEYAGLMNNREKQWLINIQLLQLNTNQPYVEDYYYTVFCDRQNKLNENQDHKDKRQNNNGHHRDSRDRDQQQNQHILTKVVYTPMQFENSLGKLQCGSVTAPRKIIDMDVVPNNDPQQPPQAQQKDSKKTRQLLLEIERLYTTQLKLEDLTNPLALLAAAEQQQDGAEGERRPVKESKVELIGKLIAAFLQLLRDDKLAALLSIRKGKMLLLRLLPHMSVTEYSSQLGDLWVGLLRGLVIIGRRDSHLLANFYPEFRRWIHTITDFDMILRLAKGLTETASQPPKNNSLAFALSNKFGVSVIASVLEQAESLFPTENSRVREWSNFVLTIVELIGANPPSVAPCQPIAANTLNQHLNRIQSLKIERYAPLELLLTDANPSQ